VTPSDCANFSAESPCLLLASARALRNRGENPHKSFEAGRLSQANYRTVSELIPEDGSIGDIDLVMFKDPNRPIGYAIQSGSQPAESDEHAKTGGGGF
jgi:hypothetical protein